ncbi:hypothetical protein KO507_07485 [Gilvimarinus agarilyticus]|uniref:hypothetical protein n=1 Tax=Gilvimarinus sp. 2_MG-2023 TaxID=3062666 RepID=UPI001C0A4981|nr:hypothetical protein [Gilvimarinus sp. 2_MG-2023]MBU2885601.1 hypothetical protein [Gilvimarinus agarilyticus]MDO6570468.1 hypothetical protein [Gilvimarinus sp. 2_MG-2023]
MALKSRKTLTALCTLALAAGFHSALAQSDNERIIEEVVVSAPRAPGPTPPAAITESTGEQISDETRQKLGNRLQVGYDPELEAIRHRPPASHRNNRTNEPIPVTVVHVGF